MKKVLSSVRNAKVTETEERLSKCHSNIRSAIDIITIALPRKPTVGNKYREIYFSASRRKRNEGEIIIAACFRRSVRVHEKKRGPRAKPEYGTRAWSAIKYISLRRNYTGEP